MRKGLKRQKLGVGGLEVREEEMENLRGLQLGWRSRKVTTKE